MPKLIDSKTIKKSAATTGARRIKDIYDVSHFRTPHKAAKQQKLVLGEKKMSYKEMTANEEATQAQTGPRKKGDPKSKKVSNFDAMSLTSKRTYK